MKIVVEHTIAVNKDDPIRCAQTLAGDKKDCEHFDSYCMLFRVKLKNPRIKAARRCKKCLNALVKEG